MILNAYIICLRCTRGSTIKRTVQSGGEASDGNIPFPLMTKGRDSLDAEDRGMIPGGEMVTEMQRTEAWFQGEHE
jgi:hypothetical protein